MPQQTAAAHSPNSPDYPRGDFAFARFGAGAVCGLLLALLIAPVRDAWRKFYKWIAL